MANISIETKKFTQLPTTQSLTDSSLMLARDVAGVKTIQFSDLRAQLQGQTYVQELKSKNLIDQALIEQGTISGGSFAPSVNRLRSALTPVEPDTTYTMSMVSTAQFYEVHEYGADKVRITLSTLNKSNQATITTGASTYYICILFRYEGNDTIVPSDVSDVQLERGSQASPYMPYAMDNIELSEICRGLQDDGFIIVPKYSFTDLGVSSTDSAFFLAWLRKLGSEYDKYKEKFIFGRVQPNSYGAVYGHMYGGVANDNTPMYSGFTYITFNGMKYFGTNNGTFFLRAVNYTVEV